MRTLFVCLLGLYPDRFRREFGEEMTEVLLDGDADARKRGPLARLRFLFREFAGLLLGACDEHLRSFGYSSDWLSLNARSIAMRSNFRYPRTTIVLMMLILGIVIGIIEKARSVAYANLPGPSMHSIPFVSTQAVVVILIVTYILGAAAWALVFAMRRSGVHRLSQTETWTHAQR